MVKAFCKSISVSVGVILTCAVLAGGQSAYGLGPAAITLNRGAPLGVHKEISSHILPSHGVGSISIPGAKTQSSTSGWNVELSGVSIQDIACPTVSNCFAIANDQASGIGEIISTTNAGQTWSSGTLPAQSYLYSISCPGATNCWAVGMSDFYTPVIFATSDGVTWSEQSVPTVPSAVNSPTAFAVSSLFSISCTSSQDCLAIGGPGPIGSLAGQANVSVAIATSDGGTTWTVANNNLSSNLRGLSCANSTDCMAVGFYDNVVETTSDGGTSWTNQLLSGTNNGFMDSVFCIPNSQSISCWVASGGDVNYTSNFGSTWSVQQASDSASIASITCATTTNCIAVGENTTLSLYSFGGNGYSVSGSSDLPSEVLTTSNSGISWTTQSAPGTSGLSDVSCPSSTQCFASSGQTSMTGTVISTSDGGVTWQTSLVAGSSDPSSSGFASMSCPTTSQCWAIQGGSNFGGGESVLESIDGGNTWKVSFTSQFSYGLKSIDCPTTSECWAVGASSTIVGTSNAGASWNFIAPTFTQMQRQNTVFASVSCYDQNHCFAIGNSTMAETSDGTNWYFANSFPVGGLNDVYCEMGTQSCWVVGGDHIYATQNGGATWLAETVPQLIGTKFTSFTCESKLDCFAAGTAQNLMQVGPPPTLGNTSTSASFGPCVGPCSGSSPNSLSAVDLVLNTQNGGQSWQVQLYGLANGQAGVDNINSIYCAFSSCYLLASQGYLGSQQGYSPQFTPQRAYIISSTNGGGTWNAQQPLSSAFYTGINCSSTTSCVTVGIGPVQGYGYFQYGPGGGQSEIFGGGVVLSTTDGGNPGPPTIELVAPSTLYTNQIGLVIVTGSNLSSTTQVSFNGKPISIFLVVGNGAIAVAIPPSYSINKVTGYITVSTPFGSSSTGPSSELIFDPPTPLAPGAGYWVATANGNVESFGKAPSFGSIPVSPNKPIVSMAATPDGDGYWLVGSDGGVFAFGDAKYLGSTGAMTLSAPIVSMAATPDGNGYWLVGSDGGVFAFGDAAFYGSEVGSVQIQTHVVGITSTPDGRGYWILASGGGIYSFGDASFFGTVASSAQSGWAVRLAS